MSEEQRITNVVKENDPRRVEAGKRLGAISRAAKENKAVLSHLETTCFLLTFYLDLLASMVK